MTAGPDADPRVVRCLRDAAELRLIALLLECPHEHWKETVAALSAEVSAPDLLVAAAAANTEANEGLYHTVLGPGGPAPPREVSYRGAVLPGGVLAEISAYYEAFAYVPECREPPDHVAVEVGFLAYLKLKEAYAVLRGATEEADVTADASHRFAEEHLSRTASAFAAAAESTGAGYLTLAGGALLERVGPPAAPDPLPWRQAEGDPDNGGCGFGCGADDAAGGDVATEAY